jgi:type IV pilus assembly protein PilE
MQKTLKGKKAMKAGQQSGFTLIELMITVAIVGILAAIAYPSYTQYVLRGHRAAAQSEMMDIANLQQQLLLANRSYAATGTVPWNNTGYGLPTELLPRYTYNIAASNPPYFRIIFTPIGAQVSDGALVLDSMGVKTRAGDPAKW